MVSYEKTMTHLNTYVVITEYYLPDEGDIYTYNGDDALRAAARKHYDDEYTNVSWGNEWKENEKDDFKLFLSCGYPWSATSTESLIKFMLILGENVIINQTGIGWKYVIVTNGIISICKNSNKWRIQIN